MAKLPEILEFSEKHDIKVINIQDMKEFMKGGNDGK